MLVRLSALALLLAASSASAASIFSPTSVIRNDFGQTGGNGPENMINGSGLRTPFASGTTSFDAYAATNPLHACNDCGGGGFYGADGTTSGVIDFDLGQSLNVQRLGLFNNPFRGIASFTVSTSDDASFATSTQVGAFTLSSYGSFSTEMTFEVLDLTDTTAQFVRFDIASTAQSTLSIGEVTFDASPAAVPVPPSMALMAGGLFGLAALRRRRRPDAA